jgi:hypothetical protein
MGYSVLQIIGAFCLGYFISNFVRSILDKISDDNTSKKVNLVYSRLLENIYSKKTFFTSRINNTVSLDTTIVDEGKVNIMYMMDKKDIAIFKNDKCIYTSDLVKTDILEEIITAIEIYHKDKIVDTVNMMGLIFSREEFEKKFNINVDGIKNGTIEFYDSQIDDVYFDIDYILDRISEVGIENLTPDEKEFLNNYNN